MPLITTSSFKTLVPPALTSPPNYTQTGSVLLGSDTVAGDFFGCGTGLSADGSIMVVGAPYRGGATGAVYTYDWNGSAWVERSTILTAGDQQAGAYFGYDVAITPDGNTMVVGALGHITTINDQGKVYIYDWNGTAWIERETFISPNPQPSEGFGVGVSISNDGLVVAVGGAFGAVGDPIVNRGAAYIYDWNGSQFQYRNQILASDGATNRFFGYGLELKGDGSVIYVGAIETSLTGSFYVYEWNGSSWVETITRKIPSDAGGGDQFGYRIAAPGNGSYIAVSSWFWDGGAGANQGAVYFFEEDGGSWTEHGSVLVAPDAAGNNYFGMVSMSDDGRVLAVAAPGRSSSAGGVYRFDSV